MLPRPLHGLASMGMATLVSGALLPAAPRGAPDAIRANTPLVSVHDGPIRLSATADAPAIFVLDYGVESEGIPSFKIVDASGDTSVFEITYSETEAALGRYMGDGPLPLAAAMDTYRVNRYNISAPGPIKNRLIQGGFRYQKLNLSSVGDLVLQDVGVTPTVHTTPLTDLPGFFRSSDGTLNDIWTAGARTVQLSEIPQNSIPEFWQVSSEGLLIDSQAPQAAVGIVALPSTTYNLEFKVKVIQGGFGFTVHSDTLNDGIYISVDVAQGTIAAHLGSTAENTVLKQAAVPLGVTDKLGAWSNVNVQVAVTEITVSIDGTTVLELSQMNKFYGSYGLGASFGHRAMFKDLKVMDANGATTYEHPLTDKSCFDDFLVGSNPLDTSVDANRRDRIAYTGDLDIAGAAALASTHGLEFILGTLELFGSLQGTPGFFVPTAKIQQVPAPPSNFDQTGLIGYSWNLLTAVAQTYMHTGDVDFATMWAPKVQRMLDWSHSQLLPSGLFNLTEASFGGDWNYYDPVQSGVVTKFNVLYAYSLQETARLLADGGVDTAVYQDRLASLRTAIDTQLWSDELGAYVISELSRSGFAQDSNAIAILAGVNQDPSHSSARILSTLSQQLSTPRGPLAFSPSAIEALGFRRYISPYASGYHLRAALKTGNDTVARELLDTLWAPMVDKANNVNYTGCFWETLDSDGTPAFGHSTSLAHGWAAGPTAELSRFMLGAVATEPGWTEWAVAPLTLGERSAQGRVPTPKGLVKVAWQFCGKGGLLSMSVEAPEGTKGTVTLPEPLLVGLSETHILVDGMVVKGTTFDVKGGSAVHIVQSHK